MNRRNFLAGTAAAAAGIAGLGLDGGAQAPAGGAQAPAAGRQGGGGRGRGPAAVAPEKLARVSAYNWMGAMAFLPAGYALAGPLAQAIGISTYLWIGAVWVVLSTAAVLCVREVRDFRGDEPLVTPAAAPA